MTYTPCAGIIPRWHPERTRSPLRPENELTSRWTPPKKKPDAPTDVRRIVRLFRPYRGRLAVVGLLVALSSLVSVASPFLLRAILDTAIPERRTGLLSLLALGMIVTAVATRVFAVLQTLLS